MQRRISPHAYRNVLLGLSMLFTVALAACGGNSSSPHITLTFLHWQGGAAGDGYIAVTKQFEQAHPNITVNFKVVPIASYTTELQTRFGGGNPPDIIGMPPDNTKDAFVKAGDIADLSSEPWVGRVADPNKAIETSPGATGVYAMPILVDSSGLIYNKAIFTKLGLSVPTTWADFLQVCQKIKAAGIQPLAVGGKDAWPLYNGASIFVATTVYHDNPQFDQDIAAGKTTYANSGWVQQLQNYDTLQQQGYFGSSPLGQTFGDSANLVASGKAAMMIQGDFSIAPIRQANPSIDLGYVALPDSAQGQTPLVQETVGVTLAVAAKSPHVAEAKEFLNYFAQPTINGQFLATFGALPAFKDVTPASGLDPALQSIVPALQTQAINANPALTTAQQTAFEKALQNMFAGSETPLQVAQALDAAK